MISISRPVAVLSLDDYIPLDGEDDVVIQVSNDEARVSVMCDLDTGGRVCVLELVFHGPAHVLRLPLFSQISLFHLRGDYTAMIDDLVEYEYSEIARDAGWDGARHYRMLFCSTNLALHVVANGVSVVNGLRRK